MAGILGVDVGGTFTDFLLLENGRLRTFKRPSTPAELGLGVIAGIGEMGSSPAEVVHGSTVATNAVLERKGARTGLLTTRGFRDILEIGRQTRPKIYDLEPQRPPPLVPREHRYELDERIGAEGQVLRAPSSQAIEALLDRVLADGIESLAISLIFAYLYPEHERQVAEAARQRGIPVSVSSDLVPEYREYERTSTTAMNAFLAPVVGQYVQALEEDLRATGAGRLRIVQSDGGSAGAATVAARPISIVLSGPAAGVAGAFASARLAGIEQIITFDMGGTSTDVALCPGRIMQRPEIEIGGLPARVPAIDVHTVGAGGGSLARLDAGGALRVGPESAGADPGPACYGRGTEPTVTDAQLVLGRLQPEQFLGGRMRLEPERARAALVGLGGDPVVQAAAILSVANVNMERAIRVISVERGYDPRDFTLVAFGGAGPLHACDLASALRIPRVLIPPFPGVLSAFGMVTAPVTRVYQRPIMRTLSGEARNADAGEAGSVVERLLHELDDEGRRDLEAEGYDLSQVSGEASLDMRYAGQSYEISVPLVREAVGSRQSAVEGRPSIPLPPLPPSPRPSSNNGRGGTAEGESGTGARVNPAEIAAAFHDLHRRRYGHADPGRAVEIVNLRYRLVVPGHEPQIEAPPKRARTVERARLVLTRQWHGRWIEAPVYDRTLLSPGDQFSGPAVVVQMDATTVLPPGWLARVDELGNLLLQGSSRASASG